MLLINLCSNIIMTENYTSYHIQNLHNEQAGLKTSCWHQVANYMIEYSSEQKYSLKTDLSKLNIDSSKDLLAIKQPYILSKLGFVSIYSFIPYVQNNTGQILGLARIREFTAKMIKDDLESYGPLFASGKFADGNNHVILVTGIKQIGQDEYTIFYKDPAYLSKKQPGKKEFQMSLGDFNTLISQSSAPALWTFDKDNLQNNHSLILKKN